MKQNHVVCKPTSWGISRAVLMGIVLIGLGIYFFYDGYVGYPKKNLEYFTHKTFEDAGKLFDQKSADRNFTSLDWKRIVAGNTIIFPENYPIPEKVSRLETPWPSELDDYTAFTTQGMGWSSLWKQYSSNYKYDYTPVETPYDDGKIFEQKVAGVITCVLGLACFSIIFIILSRRLEINNDDIIATGKTFRVQDISSIDMRQWKNKGLAKLTLNADLGSKRIRIDGLSYGGFDKKNEDSNAAAFMDALLARYSGEIVDYATSSDESES